MTSSTTKIRHGLYLPVELLDQIRVLADKEGNSINKQIEKIIKDWLASFFSKKEISRKDLLRLPLPRRKEILQAQALKMRSYYLQNNDLEGGEGDLFEYDQ